MKFLLLFISLTQAARVSNQSSNKNERALQQSEDINNLILSAESKITIEEIKTKIIDMHANIKTCIENEFDQDTEEVLPFNQIVIRCAGFNYSILLRFYEEVVFILKEITKEKIKNEMNPNLCSDKTNECLRFFIVLSSFMDKQIDVENAFRINEKQIQREVSKDVYEALLKITLEKLYDYKTV